MKKITILLITILGIYLIYIFFSNNKINYVSITDNIINNYNYIIEDYLTNKDKLDNFNNYFNSSTIKKTYQDIKNNRTIQVDKNYYYLKKILRESDVLVISVGMEEVVNYFNKYDMKNNYDCFDTMYFDIERLIKEIKKYAYGKIIFIGYYNPTNYYDANIDRFFYDIDIRLNKLMMDNDIIYINLYEMIKENKFKENDGVHLNYLANKRISYIVEYYLN